MFTFSILLLASATTCLRSVNAAAVLTELDTTPPPPPATPAELPDFISAALDEVEVSYDNRLELVGESVDARSEFKLKRYNAFKTLGLEEETEAKRLKEEIDLNAEIEEEAKVIFKRYRKEEGM